VAAAGGARVCVGVVTGAQGVRGAVRVKPFTARPEDVAGYGPVEDEEGRRSFTVRLVGRAKGVVIGRIAGIEDRDAAAALKGTRLYVARSALPPPEAEEYYHADLLGLAAVLRDGRPLGRVRAVHDFGAGDSLEIAREGAASVLVPFTRAAVPVVDIAGGRVVIDPPDGLIEEEDKGPSLLAGPLRNPLPSGEREG